MSPRNARQQHSIRQLLRRVLLDEELGCPNKDSKWARYVEDIGSNDKSRSFSAIAESDVAKIAKSLSERPGGRKVTGGSRKLAPQFTRWRR
jgi:hypothetical protein